MWLSFSAIQRLSVMASDGEIGQLEDILVIDDGWWARHLVVAAGSWFFRRHLILAPETLASIDFDSGALSLQLSMAQLEGCEELRDDPPVSLQREKARDRAAGWVPIWPMAKVSGSAKGPALGVPRPPLGDPHLRSLAEVGGYQLRTRDGGTGSFDDFLIKSGHLAARYAVARLGSWLNTRRALISTSWFSRVSWTEQTIEVDVGAGAIEDGPAFEGLEGFDEGAEEALLRHHERRR